MRFGGTQFYGISLKSQMSGVIEAVSSSKAELLSFGSIQNDTILFSCPGRT
jgi:hypothetical protein